MYTTISFFFHAVWHVSSDRIITLLVPRFSWEIVNYHCELGCLLFLYLRCLHVTCIVSEDVIIIYLLEKCSVLHIISGCTAYIFSKQKYLLIEIYLV